MATINAYKMDGLGNDFLIIDRRKSSVNLSKKQIIDFADRKNIGFDQLIYIEKELDQYVPITIFNSDGNEVDACGNGSRCIIKLLPLIDSKSKEEYEKNSKKNISLKTKNRILTGSLSDKSKVLLDMGNPIFDWNKIPLSKNIDPGNVDIEIDGEKISFGFCVNVGNPHIIFFNVFNENFDKFYRQLENFGPKIENHKLFPEKVNVTFASIVNKEHIVVRVWERGAGLTKACGTAACATAVAANKLKLVKNAVTVDFHDNLKGEREGLFISIEPEPVNKIFMIGHAGGPSKIELEV